MTRKLASAVVVAMTIPTLASAQMSPMDFGVQSQALTSSVIGNLSVGSTARAYGGTTRSPRSGTVMPRTQVRPSPGAAATLAYQSSPAAAKEAVDAFVGRLRASNPTIAAQLGSQLAHGDLDRSYASITAPYQLGHDDAGEVLTAYLVLGWMIVNGQDDSPVPNVLAARAQVASLLARQPQVADIASRTRFGEEMKIHFLVLESGWEDSRRKGQLSVYADGVAKLFLEQRGQDMRAIRLTSRGFEPR